MNYELRDGPISVDLGDGELLRYQTPARYIEALHTAIDNADKGKPLTGDAELLAAYVFMNDPYYNGYCQHATKLSVIRDHGGDRVFAVAIPELYSLRPSHSYYSDDHDEEFYILDPSYSTMTDEDRKSTHTAILTWDSAPDKWQITSPIDFYDDAKEYFDYITMVLPHIPFELVSIIGGVPGDQWCGYNTKLITTDNEIAKTAIFYMPSGTVVYHTGLNHEYIEEYLIP